MLPWVAGVVFIYYVEGRIFVVSYLIIEFCGHFLDVDFDDVCVGFVMNLVVSHVPGRV